MTFKSREGTLLAEKGTFREVGAPKGSRKKTADPTPSTINNISQTNIQNDHRVFNDNRKIHIHLNALGSEDISHIKMEQFKSLFDGSAEEIVGRMRGMMSPRQYQKTIRLAWDRLQNDLYDKQCMEVAQAAAQGAADGWAPPDEGQTGKEPSDEAPPEDEIGSSESDTDSEGRDEGPAYDRVVVDGALIKYDGNPHSEYNRKDSEKVGTIAICNLKAAADAVQLPAQFAQLLSENLSNCNNIVHPKNAGYFEYFNGAMWVKKTTADVKTFVSVWEDKIKESFDLLGERHGDAWKESFQALYAANVIGKFKHRHAQKSNKKFLDTQVKRAALLAVDNANSRIKAVESHTGKRVRRVFSEEDGESRQRKVHRNVKWEELMNEFLIDE